MRSWLRPIARAALTSYVGADVSVPTVSFTFDDGPDPSCTPLVLDALRAHGARATFFVLGERAAAHPELVRRALDEGHEIALHGLDHTGMLDMRASRRFGSLREGRAVVQRVTGARPRWFRAPYGRQGVDTVVASRVLSMRPVMWSTYAREWEDLSAAECVAFASRGLDPGAIVLLHDSFAGSSGAPLRSPIEVATIVDALLDAADARGLAVVTVGELLSLGAPRKKLWLREWRVDVA